MDGGGGDVGGGGGGEREVRDSYREIVAFFGGEVGRRLE